MSGGGVQFSTLLMLNQWKILFEIPTKHTDQFPYEKARYLLIFLTLIHIHTICDMMCQLPFNMMTFISAKHNSL